MNWQAWLQPPVLTSLGLALYGAVLATITLVQDLKKERRGWRIVTGSAFAVEVDGPIYLMVTFVSEGHRPITVDQMTLELPGKNWLANVDPRMPNGCIPITLSDSQSVSVYFGYDNIQSALRRTGATTTKVTPLAKDTSGRIYRGKPVEVPVSL